MFLLRFRSKCEYCKISKYEENSGSSRIRYLCESHVKVENSNHYVETLQGKVQLKLKEKDVNENCDLCKVTRRMCRYKDGGDKYQVHSHYLWTCETHEDRCPQHGTALTSA